MRGESCPKSPELMPDISVSISRREIHVLVLASTPRLCHRTKILKERRANAQQRSADPNTHKQHERGVGIIDEEVGLVHQQKSNEETGQPSTINMLPALSLHVNPLTKWNSIQI